MPPGSLYQFNHEEVKAYFKEKVSMHELGIQDVLEVMNVLKTRQRNKNTWDPAINNRYWLRNDATRSEAG